MFMLPQRQSPNGGTQGPALTILAIFLPSITFFFLAARCYSRFWIIRKAGIDDFLAILSYLLALVLSRLIIIAERKYKTGYHLSEVDLNTLVPHRKNIWICQIVYALSSTAIKVSVLVFYMRLSSARTRLFTWASWAAVLLNAVFMGLFIVWLSVICQPLSTYWNKFDPLWMSRNPESRCFSEIVVLPTFAFFSAFLDLLATLIPLLLVRKLDGTLREKILVYLLFAFGFLVFVFGIIRADTVLKTVNNLKDYTWMLWECWVWTLLELYTAIMAACVPANRPLFSKIYRRFRPYETLERPSERSRESALRKPDPFTSESSQSTVGQTSSNSIPLQTALPRLNYTISNHGLFFDEVNGSPLERQS